MPIVGHGDIASALIDRLDVTWFASGVSNSSETNIDAFKREENLLMAQPNDRHLVYFSSLCIYRSTTDYAEHKKFMERLVKAYWPNNHTVVRMGNIDWGSNPNTLINYIRAHKDAYIQITYRHVVSKEEFQYWMRVIPVHRASDMNIPGRMWFMPELARMIWEGKV